MVRNSFVIFALILFITGCSHGDSKYSPLSQSEQQLLQAYQLNHAFISGCVAEKIQTINRDYCDEESNFCNIPAESIFNLQQWMTVYQDCIVK